jgi:hypothetical protein
MDPMPSGGAGQAGAEGAAAAHVGAGFAQEGAHAGGAGAVGQAGAAGAGEARGRPHALRRRVPPARHAQWPLPPPWRPQHRPAHAAPRGGQEIARAVAVLQVTAAVGPERGGGARLRKMNDGAHAQRRLIHARQNRSAVRPITRRAWLRG